MRSAKQPVSNVVVGFRSAPISLLRRVEFFFVLRGYVARCERLARRNEQRDGFVLDGLSVRFGFARHEPFDDVAVRFIFGRSDCQGRCLHDAYRVAEISEHFPEQNTPIAIDFLGCFATVMIVDIARPDRHPVCQRKNDTFGLIE